MKRTALLSIATAALFALAASSAPASPQGPWLLPAVDLSATGQFASQPQITTAADGSATAVWTRNNGSNFIIQAATRPPGGSFTAPVDLSATGQNAFLPRITTATDGSATTIWSRFNGSNNIIQAATRPLGGSFTAPVDLSATGEDASQPQITTAADGSATAIWNRFNGSNFIIQAATRPLGGSFGTPVDLSATGQGAESPQITMAADGSATAIWSRSNGSNNIIQAATRPPGGSFAAPIDLSATGQHAFEPQIITAADGSATAIWSRYNGSNFIIQAASRPPGGSFGTPVDLSATATGQNASGPQITTAADGSATAIWYRSNGSNLIIQATTRPPGGSFGTPVDLSATGEDASEPQITTAADGSATAIWYRSNGSNNIIQAASTAQPSPLLQVSRQGSGAGTVTSSPPGISCGTDCAENYLSFTEVTLTATPASGSNFTGWSGGGCSGAGSCTVTMLDATTVTAGFTADQPPPPPFGKPKFVKLKITPKSKSLSRGRTVAFKVRVKNTGDAAATNLRLCAKGPKKLVRPGRCVKAGNLAAGKSRTLKIKVKVKRSAKRGSKARITFTATATGVKRTGKATVRVK